MTKEISDMHNRISTDKAYEPAFRKLEELMEVQFHLRYGDYLALYTSHMRRAARDLRNNNDHVIRSPKSTPDESDSDPDERRPHPDELKPADDLKPAPHAMEKEAWQFFLRESWSAIYERLQDENVFNTGKECPNDPLASDVPLVRLLQVVARLINQDTLGVAKAIGAYVDRNKVAHSQLQFYIQKKDSLQIAAYFSTDLEALATPPRNCAKNVPIIKTAILFITLLFFKEFRWDDERQKVTLCIPDPAFLEDRSSTAEKARLEEYMHSSKAS
ncbi:uncharacterized protein TrAtP1_003866 [Trichoderma atroviride]|uniref:uncharacterized protein n=1 Tax=Hypocrea atroviridis TaxID=63577 RepID=UPI00332BD5C5|nr:hypothetical protein TrAtP1_003866 [Trichoderma atroviride]